VPSLTGVCGRGVYGIRNSVPIIDVVSIQSQVISEMDVAADRLNANSCQGGALALADRFCMGRMPPVPITCFMRQTALVHRRRA
jgi:hypothetical protein